MRTVITDFSKHVEAIRNVRIEVFVNEQQIPYELEFDDQDETCTHAVVFDDENAVATGRLNMGQDGRIGRIAVLKSHRRRGLGSEIMRALELEAIKLNAKQIWFHAQVRAVEFYQSLGYTTEGTEFPEDGIPHVVMRKQL
ncbi:MAG: GNAT family N-acetyltransferase [Mariniblastus sp.]